ncbi:hypothetical protein MYX76_05795 [Desulfobacterota bacterium AH_259_B03_O07]|nr:hypothetical protein [Desulfobacterota bacterium AH_259_B03_O07]
MNVLKLFYVFILGLTLLLPLSLAASAQPRTDYFGPGDSGAAYDFYLDWMYPKRNVGLNPAPAQTKPLTVKVKPRTDFFGPGDSGAAYDFYLDWMYPKRNIGLNPAPVQTKPLTVKVKPRTDYVGPGDSGAAYDFYLDWMSPRVKPKTPRIIQFLTREKSDAESQVNSKQE